MTPDERALLTSFLQDLGQARAGQKDPEAAQLISQAMNSAPDAPYLLVQHTILSDQALHAAQARIADLEAQLRNAQTPAQPTNFLGAQGGPWGRQPQTAVPPTGYAPPPQYPPPQYPPQYAPPPQYGPFSQGGGLGSFLRSAGTTAAGVAGGEMLFSGLSGLFGHGGGFGGGMFGGPGLFGGGGGYAQPVENVTINNYDDAGSGYGGGDQYTDDQGDYGGSDDGSSSI